MDREIKFRGKYESQLMKIWAIGSLLTLMDGRLVILVETDEAGNYVPINVDKETVGQYIGVKDVAGEDVYEGDIVEGYVGERYISGKVVWEGTGFEVMEEGDEGALYEMNCFKTFEVVGNIYEEGVMRQLSSSGSGSSGQPETEEKPIDEEVSG